MWKKDDMKSMLGVIHAAQRRVKKTIVRIERTERNEFKQEEMIDENDDEDRDAVEEDKEVEVDDNNSVVVLFVVFCVDEFNCCESLEACCCGVVRLEFVLLLF